MKTDKEYFEKHFAICELLAEKQLMVETLWGSDSKGHFSENHYESRRNIATLNALVLDEEERLHREVASARAKGAAFAFEKFAGKLGLKEFERRTVLFFLHMDLFRTGHVGFERRVLAGILDCEGTPISRSNALLDLFPGSRLFKKKIITELPGGSEVRLSVPLRDQLRKIVCGRKGKGSKVRDDHEEGTATIGKISPPEYRLEDIVLSPEKRQEILLHVDTYVRMGKLEAIKNMQRGKGLGMLFFGPPGTGKSMLAHGIASRLKKQVLQVNVSQVRSKWFGESEKNIVKIFQLAKEKDCVLCLDEADSLIFSRENATRGFEISQANVFLEETEKFNGIFIMTTNMEQRLDAALERRVAVKVKFEIPGSYIRQEIWRNHIPSSVKFADDIDWSHLGEKYVFSGGYIKNAVLSAIRRMLADNRSIINMDDLLFGAQIEDQGRFLKDKRGPMGFATRT